MAKPEQELQDWLKLFEQCVRSQNFAAAKPLFHARCYCFGTKAKRIFSAQDLVENQWKVIWPHIQGFCFDYSLLECRVSQSGDLATAICPWDSTGFHADGRPFPRSGRVTIIFHKNEAGDKWLAYHTHFSLNPGTPQKTHIAGSRLRFEHLR